MESVIQWDKICRRLIKQCRPSGTQGRHLKNTTDLAHSGLGLNYNPPVVGRGGGFLGSEATLPRAITCSVKQIPGFRKETMFFLHAIAPQRKPCIPLDPTSEGTFL